MVKSEIMAENSFMPSVEKAQMLCSAFLAMERVCTLEINQFPSEEQKLLQTKLEDISDFIDSTKNINEKAVILNTFLESVQMTEKKIGISPNTPGAMFSYYIRKKWKELPIGLKQVELARYEVDYNKRENKK